MGNSYSSARGLWRTGTSTISSTTIQDDLAVITSSTNQFGYRVDDFGNSTTTATPAPVINRAFTVGGVIERSTDSDYFSFVTVAGAATFTVATAQFGAMLDATLEVRDSNDNVVASADTTSFGESLGVTLATGTYYAVVKSKGGYGDIGTYTLSASLPALEYSKSNFHWN